MRAIISVSDRTGLADLVRGLAELGVEIFTTADGGKRLMEEAGVKVHSVLELTGFPEILDGRVKSLHPAIHGGILAKRNLPNHMNQLAERGIQPIDLVVVNLYPFAETIAKESVTLDEALEKIDIGGATLIRAAAKNFPDVIVLVDPRDYDMLLSRMRKGEVDLELRQELAEKAFQYIATYDTIIAQYLRGKLKVFPEEMTIALRKYVELSHGENKHQQATFYVEAGKPVTGIASATQLGGEKLSFNDILDLDSALKVVSDFDEPTVAIIKHNDPCGLASHEKLAEACQRALAGDPVAAFGGIVASNRPIDLATAQEISKTFFNAIIAPQYEAEALTFLRRKRDLRILALEIPPPRAEFFDFRRVKGGFLVQTADFFAEEEMKPKTVTRRGPVEEEWQDLLFAWKAVKHVKSNAIVIAKDKALLGVGGGQPSRVASVEIALKKAGERAKGSVLASDAFFPFPDGVELAGKGGVTAIIQPGGSIRDEEVIKVANEYNIAMVFTGVRHFKH